ncbi:MAG: hypothetical protein FGF52_02820 [Candidatus Brockarchaeota archaeon]|nr:hypothetical protein [Candidatus Brockarchaeota archaeon]
MNPEKERDEFYQERKKFFGRCIGKGMMALMFSDRMVSPGIPGEFIMFFSI